MSDYLQVPPSHGNTLFDFYENGVNICEYAGTGHISVAYSSEISYNIRVGVYYDANYYFVFVSDVDISSIDIRLVGGAPSTVATCSSLVNQTSNGYYGITSYTPTNPSFNVNVYNSLSETLEAIGFPDTPSTSSGVVVTVNASPNYIPPSTNGVIVTVIGRLLDSNQQGGTSTTGGGDGTFDETSDVIPVPNLPDISVVNTGLVTLFRPTQQEVAALGSYLWTNFADFIENLQKLFTNPMDYFIAFNIFPVSPLVTNAREIYIGNWATNILMPPVANQWYEFDCGTVTLQKYWGSALDYAPNTKVQLMLPYIGAVQLNTDEVMGQQIGVKYRIDLLSGSCVAMVTVNGNVYYQFTGECAVAVPLTGADWSRVYSAVIGAVGTAITGGVGAVMTGNAGGAAMSAFATGKAANAVSSAGYSFAKLAVEGKGIKGIQAAREATIAAMQSAADAAKNAASASGTVAQGIRATRIANTVNNTVGQVMGAKTSISHSGTISGSAGMLGVRDAYLIVEYPNQSLAQDYKHFVGYPSNMYARLGTLSGYTEVEQVIPEGIWGTDDELAELVEALKSGVYL